MTAIIGYTKRIGTNSIGVLCTDDLVDNRNAKVDKITKVADRFAISVAGLEIVNSLLYWVLCYFEQFNIPKQSLNTIHDLERELTIFLPSAIRKLKERNVCKNVDEQIDLPSIIVVLDCSENKLYFSNIGAIWSSDESSDYKIEFTLLADCMYLFGSIAGKDNYMKNNFDEFEISKIVNMLKCSIVFQHSQIPQYVGNPGAYVVNLLGDKQGQSFISCYTSVEDLLDNMIGV